MAERENELIVKRDVVKEMDIEVRNSQSQGIEHAITIGHYLLIIISFR